MRIRGRLLAITIALYGSLGELYFRAHQPVYHPQGCKEGPDWLYWDLARLAAFGIYLVSTGLFARQSEGAWRKSTVVHAILTLTLGLALGFGYFSARMVGFPSCDEIFPCTEICKPTDALPVNWLVVIVVCAGAIAVPVGWLGRRILSCPS
jgi:hypothetical protein